MRCSSCNEENPEGVKFCGECGATLGAGAACGSRGTVNPPNVKFCHECGQSLGGSTVSRQATPTPAPALPSSFASGRYQVQRFLGEGGKKRVYLSHDSNLDRDVAIALIKNEGLTEEGIARIQREGQTMGQLGDHPHIVTAYHADEEAGQHYIVMEYTWRAATWKRSCRVQTARGCS